jgi:hypothetical protein
LLFDLLSLHFVELVRSRKWWDEIIFYSKRVRSKLFALIESHVIGSTEALEFAQTKLSPFGKEGKYMEKLEVRCFFP